MDRDPKTRFLYHANAVALGGRITRPFCEVIESQASAVLPITGGYGTGRVERFRYRDLVSFDVARSSVVGNESEEDGRTVHNSLATVTIEGLDVASVVTADAVVARLVSRQVEGEEPVHLPVGSYFANLRIAGIPFEPKTHPSLLQHGSLLDLAGACGKVGPVDGDGAPIQFDPADLKATRTPAQQGRPGKYPEQQILTSIFDAASLPTDGPGKRVGTRIEVPGFGAVFLGEYLITRFARQLTMLRIEMGSPVAGTVTASLVQGNGSTYP